MKTNYIGIGGLVSALKEKDEEIARLKKIISTFDQDIVNQIKKLEASESDLKSTIQSYKEFLYTTTSKLRKSIPKGRPKETVKSWDEFFKLYPNKLRPDEAKNAMKEFHGVEYSYETYQKKAKGRNLTPLKRMKRNDDF